MSATTARELRLAVAMNGGVSLAVWIGGVAHELDRFARKVGPWADVVGDVDVRIDVCAGTSAGGINAAFLAIAQRYGVDLTCLRQLWMDKAGLEPPQGSPADEVHLMNDPRTGVQSLLNGRHFHEQLRNAFAALLDQAPDAGSVADNRIDLRLTTTAFGGADRHLADDLGGGVGEREHRASFHFVDESPAEALAPRRDLSYATEEERDELAAELARAARSTASFPFAFEPSVCEGTEGKHLDPAIVRRDQLLDGGILNNLPVDQALEAVFAMPATQPVDRWLVAVVPDPSVLDMADAATEGATDADEWATVKEIVTASVVSIPRNQTVGTFVDDVKQRNQRVDGRRRARLALLENGLDELGTAAGALWSCYRTSRTTQAALAELGKWPEYTRWEQAVLLRQLALLLQLHTMSGSGETELRRAIHDLRLVDQAVGGGPDMVSIRSGQLLARIARSWVAVERPRLVSELGALAEGAEADERARQVLIAIEVVQGAFDLMEHGAEQKVKLGLLTPQRPAALDPRGRNRADEKLAGDELGHFGAFLKRSWRANDWMWGRLDAASFLFALLAEFRAGQGQALDDAFVQQRAVQTGIVREEAPRVCASVLADDTAGAVSRHGKALVPLTSGWDETAKSAGAPVAEDDAVNARRWVAVRDQLLASPGQALGHGETAAVRVNGDGTRRSWVNGEDERAAERFLDRCRIGEEHVTDELWTSLVARVGLKATATTLTVGRSAGLPLRSLVNKALIPVRGIALIANRYSRALRPRRAGHHGPAYFGRITTELLAVLCVIDLLGVGFGRVGPFIWAGFSALLLTLFVCAPLTTVLTVGGIGLPGLAMTLEDRWLPDGAPDWVRTIVPLPGWIGMPLILVSLVVISFQRVDQIDWALRRWGRRMRPGGRAV
jgi:predicted acylesterase/phospholipase RssA